MVYIAHFDDTSKVRRKVAAKVPVIGDVLGNEGLIAPGAVLLSADEPAPVGGFASMIDSFG
ncbi:hypothetical protein F183_A28720 [Bryobacterales bacterium F-183]|nr:hypothetical protein F183_A28720 [Bryobacterales bacterium F-183]